MVVPVYELIEYYIGKDGNMWFAVGRGFVNLQESKSGWGSNPIEALENYFKAIEEVEDDS